jgi:hypothetical protein
MCDFLAGLRSQITRLADGGCATIGLSTELHELADSITDQIKSFPGPRVIIDKRAEPDLAKRCLLRAAAAATQSERDDWTEAAAQLGDNTIGAPPQPPWRRDAVRAEAFALIDCWLAVALSMGPLPRSTSGPLIDKIIQATEPLPAASNASHHSG